MGLMSQFTKKVIDHLDVYPSTLNVVAYREGQAVASIRSVEYSPKEKILNLSYDFSESYKNINSAAHTVDMLVVCREMAKHQLLIKQILRTTLGLLARRNVPYVFFVCPQEVEGQALQIGFKPLGDNFTCPTLNRSVRPLVINVREFYDLALREIADQEIIRFQEVFYTTVFDPGEILAVEGERGNIAYLIEEGEVEVLIQKADQLVSISTIGAGRLTGEVAMVTSETRTASLIAKRATSCISFDRGDFIRLMYEEPHRSIDLFKIFSKRLNESNKRITEVKRN